MSTTVAYTPLESLLLFQSLVAYGSEDQDFNRISDLLTHNALVKDGETFDAQRLTSDSLRNFYLQLLRDELKAEEQDGLDDSSSTGSRKRKLQTPPLPSIKDTQEYKDKLPLLVDRLYARYRDHMVQGIREDERKYAKVQQEIGEIERGEWDNRILKEDRDLAKKNANLPTEDPNPKTNGALSKSLLQEGEKVVEDPVSEGSNEHTPAKSSPPANFPLSETQPKAPLSSSLNSQQPTPTSPTVLEQKQQTPIPSPPNNQKTGSNGPRGPSPLQPPNIIQPPQQSHPPQLQPPTQSGSWKWEPPYGPPHQTSGYPTGQYASLNNPQFSPQYPLPARGSFSSPHGLPPPHPIVPSSPVNAQQHSVLLPPPSMHQPPSSPGMPLNALADVAGQQYRAPSGSPMIQQAPQHTGYPPQYSPHQGPSPTSGPGPWPQPYMQPYPGTPQQYQFPQNQRTPFQTQPTLIQPENRQYNSPYNASHGAKPSPNQSSTPKPCQNLPHTPLAQGPLRAMTGSGTRWTPNATGSTPRTFTTVQPPAMEMISPILVPAKLPEIAKKSTARPFQKSDQPKSSRATKRGLQRTRAGSTASSVIGGSHRSQSVTSHADELSMDMTHHVKEEVATPLGVEDAGDTTADETFPRFPSRASRASNKRKRASSHSESRSPSLPPTHVLWTRAFPKISTSALESISGHRNASTFAAPVKDRDAPGYKNLILRPQDLKSIRSAITAGHRAATAAAPDDMNPSAASVLLPISEDLIPPKGIINYAQLEKELMRIFANAIMFNADPDRGFGGRWQGIGKDKGDNVGYEIDEDSIVKDTRAMFADVEKVVGELRSAERRSEEIRDSSVARANIDDDDVDELAGDDHHGEGHAGPTGSVTKRRRKA